MRRKMLFSGMGICKFPLPGKYRKNIKASFYKDGRKVNLDYFQLGKIVQKREVGLVVINQCYHGFNPASDEGKWHVAKVEIEKVLKNDNWYIIVSYHKFESAVDPKENLYKVLFGKDINDSFFKKIHIPLTNGKFVFIVPFGK